MKERCNVTYARRRCSPFQAGIEGARCTLDAKHEGRHLARIVVEFGTRPEEEVLGDFWFERSVDVEPEAFVLQSTPQGAQGPQELYEPFMRALIGEEKRMPVFYVNIACVVTKEQPEGGFSAREMIPVRVEAETAADARGKVGDLLSKLIAGEAARAKAIKELDELTKEARELRFGGASKGDPNVR